MYMSLLTSMIVNKDKMDRERRNLVMIKIKKNLLTTASLLAITSALSSNALANLAKSDGNGPILLQNGNIPINTSLAVAWQAHDSLALDHIEPINVGGAGATISVIDLHGYDSTLQISADSSLASVINSTAGSDALLGINIDDGRNLTIEGQDGLKYDGTAQAAGVLTALGNIQLGSGALGGNLTINSNVTLPNSIDSQTDHTGIINIQQGKKVIFKESIGSQSIVNQMNLTGNKSIALLKSNSFIDQIEFQDNGAKLILDNDTVLEGNIDSNGNGGKLVLKGNNQITGTIGANNPLSRINVNSTPNAGNISIFRDTVNTKRLDISENTVLISQTNSIANANKISIGNDAMLSIDTDGNYNLNNAQGIQFDNQDSTLQLKNTSPNHSVITLKNRLAPGLDANGILELNATGAEISLAHWKNSTIGIDNANRLNNFVITGNQNIIVDADTFAKTITVDSTGDVVFNKDIDSGADSTINFGNNGNTTFNGNVTTEKIDFSNHARVVTLNGTINTNQIISTIGNGSKISLIGNSNLNLANPSIVAIDQISAASAGATASLGSGQYNVSDIQIIDQTGTIEIGDETAIIGGFNINGGDAGNIKLKGNAAIMGNLGSAAFPIGAVSIEGFDKILKLDGDVNVASLDANNANSQYLEFNNFNNINVEGNIGHTEAFEEIRFNGSGTVTFGAGSLQTGQNLSFNTNTHVITNKYDLGNTNISNTTSNNKLSVNVDQNINGIIGTNNNFFGELNIDSPARTEIIINSNQFFAGITGVNASVTLNHDGILIPYLGQDTTPIKYTNFVENGTINGAVYVENIDIQDGKKAEFNHHIFNAELTMNGPNSIAEFHDKTTISSPISGNGKLYFNDGAIINDKLGTMANRLSQVHFNGDTIIDSNIYSNEIEFNNCTLTVNNNIEFNGQTTFNDTEITLNNDLVMKNGNVELIGAMIINTKFDGTKVNSITASTGSTIKLDNRDTLQINIDDSNTSFQSGTVVKPLVVDSTGKLSIDLLKVSISSTNPTSNWVASVNEDELVLTQTSDTSNSAISRKSADPIKEETKENIQPNPVSISTDQATLSSIIKKVTSSVNRAATASMNATGQAEKLILRRSFGTQLNRQISVASKHNDNITGISSGDDAEKHGIWASTGYSNNVQKEKTGSPGYKSHSFGGTLGFDTKISEDSLIGFALSVSNTNIKHKDSNAGDKTDITSYLLSAYANQTFSSNWYGQGILSIGSSEINHKDKRSIGTFSQTATSNYNSTIFSTEIMLGYNNILSNKSSIIPMFGLSYYGVSSQAYKETGAANMQLLSVGKMSSHKLDAIAGVKFSASPIQKAALTITPEAHAFINHDLIGKSKSLTAQLDGINFQTQKAKLQKTFYNLGGSLNITHGSTDYGLSLDTNLAPKYIGVQGTLKVRVNL